MSVVGGCCLLLLFVVAVVCVRVFVCVCVVCGCMLFGVRRSGCLLFVGMCLLFFVASFLVFCHCSLLITVVVF